MAASFLGHLAIMVRLGLQTLVFAEEKLVATDSSKSGTAALCPHSHLGEEVGWRPETHPEIWPAERREGSSSRVRSLNVTFGYCPGCHIHKFLGECDASGKLLLVFSSLLFSFMNAR